MPEIKPIKNGLAVKYEKDSIVLIETGEYDDHAVIGVYRALRDFTDEEVALFFAVENEEILSSSQGYDYSYCDNWDAQDEFVKYLIKNKYMEEIKNKSLHIGSYGRLEIE